MAQRTFNNTQNINIASNVSMWFQRDFAGNYVELGDLLVDGVNLAPEFSPFRTYRNGVNALGKNLLTNRSASITATLNEPNIRTLERVLYGSVPVSGQSTTALEGKTFSVKEDGSGGTYIDLTDADETDFSNITVTGIYASTDVLEATNLISANILPDTDGLIHFDSTDTGLDEDDSVYVKYSITVDSLTSTTIFGATDTTIEGAAKLQARNLSGGVTQLWDLASVSLAPNGDLTYALDTIQTVPILCTLQERAGSFGTVYAK